MPDGLAERGVLLALRDHHHGERGRQLTHLLVGLDAALARHLLVEQEEIEGAAAERLRIAREVAAGKGDPT